MAGISESVSTGVSGAACSSPTALIAVGEAIGSDSCSELLLN